MGAQGKIQFLVGGVKGGIDAVMHTMKLDVLLHKTRIKVPRFGIYTYMI